MAAPDPRSGHDVPATASSPAPPPARRPWSQRLSVRALKAAAVFVLGLVVGGVLVGFAVAGPEPPAPHVTVTRAAPPPVPGGRPAGTVKGKVQVNQACLQAINASQSSYAGLKNLLDALRAFDASRVDHALVSLQPLETQLRKDLATCRVTAQSAPPTAGASSGAGH